MVGGKAQELWHLTAGLQILPRLPQDHTGKFKGLV